MRMYQCTGISTERLNLNYLEDKFCENPGWEKEWLTFV